MRSIVLKYNKVAGEQQHGLPQELRKSYTGAVSFFGIPWVCLLRNTKHGADMKILMQQHTRKVHRLLAF